MKLMTWRRLAPAARSRPTSRIRSATVIDRVLKMRNAPANRAIAAMSAVVTAKSVVEARRVAAMSAGVDRMYGSRGQPRLEGGLDVGGGRALGETDVDAGDARVAEDGLGGLQRDDDGPPVPRRRTGPSPAMMPMTRYEMVSPRPSIVIGDPIARPSSAARRSLMRALCASRVGRGHRPRRGRGRGAADRGPGRCRGRSRAAAARPPGCAVERGAR